MNLNAFGRNSLTALAVILASACTQMAYAQQEPFVPSWEEQLANGSRQATEQARKNLEQNDAAPDELHKPTQKEARGLLDTFFGRSDGKIVDHNDPDRVAKVIYLPTKGYEKFSPELVQRANMVKFYGPLSDLRVLVGESQKLAVFAIQTCDQATFDAAMKDLDYALKDLKQMHQQVADITNMNESQSNYYNQQRLFELDPATNPENATFSIAGYHFGVEPFPRHPDEFTQWEKWTYEPQATREERSGKLQDKMGELMEWDSELQRIDEVIVKSQATIETNRQKLQQAFKEKACEACGID